MNNFKKGLFLVFLTWGSYFTFIFSKALFRDENGISSLGVIWGDWAAHFTYAAPFTYRPINQWFLSNPVFIERKFTYSFVVDAFSGLLMRIGVDEIIAFSLPSLILVLLMLFAIYRLTFFYFPSARKSFLVTTLFLTNGGLGFIWFFKNIGAKTFPDVISLSDHKIKLMNFVTSEIMPQRGIVLGIFIVLSIWLTWSIWQKNNFKDVSWKKIFFWGSLVGILPLVHIHSFIVLFISGIVFLVFDLKNWKKWIFFAIIVAFPTFFIWKFFYQGQIQLTFFSWHPGWLANEKSLIDWIWFWLLNWGLFLPLAFFSTWKTGFYKKPLFYVGLLLFISANLILFQPWDMDNMKILTYTYLIFCLPITCFLIDLLGNKKIAYRLFSILLILFLTFSGWIEVYGLARKNAQQGLLWTTAELDLAKKFRAISSPGDIVLTSDKHNHFISTHTGARILMGYRGWLWSYGINYATMEKDISMMYQGKESAKFLLEKYNIKYVVIGLSEKNDFNANEQFFLNNFPVAISSDEYKIFKIQ
ncbi:MAG: hypothetical protein WCK16_03980 [Candidatus Moraniibacteriota bacterium]